MLYVWLVATMVVCAWQAIRAMRLLSSAVWLAGASASVALLLYALGAYEVAVIELSVGTGLVTVLLVFAIGIAGEDAIAARSLVPQPLAWGLVLLAIGLLAWSMLPTKDTRPPTTTMSLTQMVWEQRALDLYVQVALIFAGVLGVLGLLSETPENSRLQIPDCRLQEESKDQSEICNPQSAIEEGRA